MTTTTALANMRLPLCRTMLALTFGVFLMWSGVAQAAVAPDSFSSLAKNVSPSVVWISSTQEQKKQDTSMEMPFKFPEGSPFEEFFRRFRGPDDHDAQPAPTQALGSGFIIDPAGYIVTNNHVINGAAAVRVKLDDEREYKATVIGTDPLTDLALLKIETGTPLPALSFGDSDKAEVGDWVMAVGNPFGLGGTVTAGIISAHGRNIDAGPYDDFLQVDAAINKGNSGGPLFNLDGRVIGVNTAIFSPNGGSVGIGFAIPSNLVEPVISQIRENGRVERGWLGVQIQKLTRDIAGAIGVEGTDGALVSEVIPDSPAANAGLRQADIIRKVDGKTVDGPRDLARMIARKPVGRNIELELWRDGASRTVKVVAGEMPTGQKLAAAESEAQPDDVNRSQTLGADLAAVTPELRAELQIPKGVDGVVVTNIDPGPIFEQGLRVGDLIRQVAHEAVTSPAQVDELVRNATSGGKDAVLLLVNRQGHDLFLGLKPAMA
jgi:serine protease Do